MKALILIVALLVVPVSGQNQSAEFQRFDRYMVQVRQLAPRYGYRIAKDDEAWEEWFWLYYFQEGVTPRKALVDTRRYDKQRAVRMKRRGQ